MLTTIPQTSLFQAIPSIATTTTATTRPFSSALSRISNQQQQQSLQTTTTTSISTFRTSLSSPLASTTALQQSRSFSASAALGAKRDTYNPSRRVQKRRHGFLARLRTRSGRKVLQRRKLRGKKALSW